MTPSTPPGNATSVAIQRLPHAGDLPLPTKATSRSAGLDLLAAVPGVVAIQPGERVLVPTGIALALPVGTEGQIRARSGLAWKHGVTVLNAPGTIDADYQGEVKVILYNAGTEPFVIERGMRIAQLVIAPYVSPVWQEVEDITAGGVSVSDRSSGGFGSTGLFAKGHGPF